MTGPPADPDVAARLGRITSAAVRSVRRLGGQHERDHYYAVLADGRQVFAKVAGADLDAEIGRASCRERVCLSV